MTVIDDCPVTCGPEPGAAEALFKEAKRCERRRRLFTAATVILLVVAGTIAASIGAGGHSRAKSPTTAPALSPEEILRLDDQGLSGNFEATYKVTGDLPLFPGPVWTVVVAHRGPAPSNDWMLDGGEWSFVLRAGHGYELQWIEQASHYQQCWRNGTNSWTCGKGTTYAANAFIMQTLPYVPGTVDGEIGATVQHRYPLVQGEHQRLTVASQQSVEFGTLRCLTGTTWFSPKRKGAAPADLSSTTWCLTVRGLPASENQRGNPSLGLSWADLTLISTRRVAPNSDFQPMSAIAARGTLPGP